ncbi:MAG TPA: tol-pal system-associated acyl-CoA thioesterase [Casimicrobiaceae bacterium]|nr:tol-pal system-associated acyl-CoA thioesterase [Casimicrobiaceae bacterium]
MSPARRMRETFRFPIRVYYEDTDAGGVVYYANYLKYMERARTEWLSSLGYELSTLESVEGIVFVVHRVEIDYRIPAKLGERIHATLTLAELNRASMSVEQDIVRGDELLTHARVALACVDRANWRPKRIPAQLHERLERLP